MYSYNTRMHRILQCLVSGANKVINFVELSLQFHAFCGVDISTLVQIFKTEFATRKIPRKKTKNIAKCLLCLQMLLCATQLVWKWKMETSAPAQVGNKNQVEWYEAMKLCNMILTMSCFFWFKNRLQHVHFVWRWGHDDARLSTWLLLEPWRYCVHVWCRQRYLRQRSVTMTVSH